MNCEHLQESIYDYLDGTLSTDEKAAAQKHLLACSACRQSVQRELLLAQTLSNRLRQAVEPVALDANAQRGMTRAVQWRIAESQQHSSFSFWSRLAMPVAAAALILMGTIWIGHYFISERAFHFNAPVSLAASSRLVPVHFSYSVHDYTFHKEGALVVDALTDETRFVEGALLVEK